MTMGATKSQIFRIIKIKIALPSFFSGLKVACVSSVIGAIVAEWIGSKSGLGWIMKVSGPLFQTERVFASILILSMIASLLFIFVKFLENKIPVLCEKPIAHTYQDGREIIKVATENNTRFMVGYNQRYYASYKKFQEARWGKPIYAESVWSELVSGWHPHEDYRESYAVRPDLGGGVPLTLSHDFDWWTGLFGDLNVLSVHHSTGALDVDIPTSYDIVLDNQDSSVQVRMHLDYEGMPPKRYYKVEYEKGELFYDPLNAECKFIDKTGKEENILIPAFDHERRSSFVNTFIKFMHEDKTPNALSDWELGLTALEIADTVENWK